MNTANFYPKSATMLFVALHGHFVEGNLEMDATLLGTCGVSSLSKHGLEIATYIKNPMLVRCCV
jgi:hypothetical protein